MTQLQFGDAELIERRKAEEKRQAFASDLFELVFHAELPWALIGYLMASVADSILVDCDDIQAALDFKAGFEKYAKENKAFLNEADFPQ